MIKDIIKKINENSNKVIYTGSKVRVDKVMDALQSYEEKNGFLYQGYYSHTKDYKSYVIEIDNLKEFEKHKKWMNSIIKKVG